VNHPESPAASPFFNSLLGAATVFANLQVHPAGKAYRLRIWIKRFGLHRAALGGAQIGDRTIPTKPKGDKPAPKRATKAQTAPTAEPRQTKR